MTNPSAFCLKAIIVAHRMFERWRQENFFKYMREEYLIDALADYQVEPDDPDRSVSNPARKALEKEIHTAQVHLRKLQQRYGAVAIDQVHGHKRAALRSEVADEKMRKEIDRPTASRNSRPGVNLCRFVCRLLMPAEGSR